MTEEHLQIVREEIAKTITIVVNGKIDRLHAILEKQNEKTDMTAQQLASHLEHEAEFQTEIRAHMEAVKPYLEGAQGFKMVRGFLIWIAGGLIAWASIKNNFRL